MADISFDVNVDTAVLDSKWSEAAMRGRMMAAMNETVAMAQTEVRTRVPVDTGAHRGSVQTSVRGTGTDVRGTVFSPLPTMIVLERGRRPGARPPPSSAIVGWLSRHGIAANLAFVVARSIGRKGTKGARMFELAAEQVKSRVNGIFAWHFR